MQKRYPAHFHQLGDHDDAETVLLPHHPPEVVDHLLLGACRGERGRRRRRYAGRWKGEVKLQRREGGRGEINKSGRKSSGSNRERSIALLIRPPKPSPAPLLFSRCREMSFQYGPQILPPPLAHGAKLTTSLISPGRPSPRLPHQGKSLFFILKQTRRLRPRRPQSLHLSETLSSAKGKTPPLFFFFLLL